jgi:tetratricopeptide (TPR) repeat protein
LNLFNEKREDSKKDLSIGIKKRAVEERFGIWLQMNEKIFGETLQDLMPETTEQGKFTKLNLIKDERVKKIFKSFNDEILEDYRKGSLIQNSVFFVLLGNIYLDNERYNEAIDEYTNAIRLDSHYIVNAFYNRGFARIQEYGGEKCLGLGNRNLKEENQLNEAIADFKDAKRIIEDHLEPMLNIIQHAATSSEALSEQVVHKSTLYGIQKNSIEIAIGLGENAYEAQLKSLEDKKQDKNTNTEDKSKIDKTIKELKEKKHELVEGIIQHAISKGILFLK